MSSSKDTPQARQAILQALREGNAYAQAASHGGVSRWTLIKWRKDDPDFDEQCHVAEAEGIHKIEDVVLKTAKSSDDQSLAYTAAKFILERRKPTRDDYAPANPNGPLPQFNLNVLAQVAPPVMQMDRQALSRPVIEGQVVTND